LTAISTALTITRFIRHGARLRVCTSIGEPKGVSKRGRAKKGTSGVWRGTTWFFVQGAQTIPAPPRRRMRKKGPPAFVTEEWELMKKLKANPEFAKQTLVDSLAVAGIERANLSAAQRRCPDLKAAYLGKLASELGRDPREALLEVRTEDPGAFEKTKLDAVLRSLDKYEMINNVLFRRVYNSVSSQVELRCAVPSGAAQRFDFPGRGHTPLGFRERILLEYHNGKLGGHQGRERTMDMVSRDFWWPGLYGDIRRWCSRCEVCRAERGASGLAA